VVREVADQLVRTPLWTHQLEDAEYLSEQPRVLVGWEMGTGKTLLAVERDLRLRRDDFSGPTLVVAPLNTHESWVETFRENTDLKVKKINRKLREWFVGPKGEPADVYVMHYEVLRLMPELQAFGFGHVIFDECHKLQNRKAAMTKAAKRIATMVPFITAMSGSPVTTNPQNIWSVLNVLKPRTYSSYWKFYNRYVDFEIQYPQGYHKVLGPSAAWRAEGFPAMREFFVRRLKEDVLPDLPPKVYGKRYVDLSPEQRRQYDDMKRDMIAWLETYEGDNERPLPAAAVISQLQRLQMFALGTATFGPPSKKTNRPKIMLQDPSSKVDAVMELLEDNPGEQFVIFTQFKGPLRILRARFDRHGYSYASFTGDDHPRLRELGKRAFIRGERRCLLGTIGSGGVGVDGLQHASCNVIFLDRSWSPAINSQAEDRLHRGGQTRTVNVIDIMARDTVDFQRLERLELKKKWIKEMLGD
jgi:SNF2 family DNA or RNA helicase